ncbi:hypothetical protein SKAU_G00014150 [Synaphobranchus kaupii]|uniref:Uncharacterized protein n=1 Tax=Synaphobranchus kaupii TaxID=118154 RepID=A0A9Q1JDM7_SYNKA|nr:hypothetical protein SKAU_G00014150 [Synaphobranchus kaupii]
MGWLPVERRVSYLKLGYVFRIMNGTAPRYLASCIVLRSQVHGRELRSGPLSVCEPKGGSRLRLFGAVSIYRPGEYCWVSATELIRLSSGSRSAGPRRGAAVDPGDRHFIPPYPPVPALC